MSDYHIFLMGEKITPSAKSSNKNTQIQLLCIRRNDDERDQFEDEVYGILLMYHRKQKLTERKLNKYFPSEQANVFNNSSHSEADRMFVNVHFTFDVDIRWSKVGYCTETWRNW